MKKDKAREIVQKRTRWIVYRPEIAFAPYSGRKLHEVWKIDKFVSGIPTRTDRRERKPVSVKPKRMYGGWGW